MPLFTRFGSPRSLTPVVIAATLASGYSAAAQGIEESAKDIIAAQIRRQGYMCEQAESAVRDPSASRPDEAAWILTCNTASYRVRLIPGLAAKVELLTSGSAETQRP